MNGEAILFHPEKNRFIVLNSTSSFLWGSLETPSTAEDLAAGICQSFEGVTLPDVLNDVQDTLSQMLSLEVIVPADQPSATPEGGANNGS